MSRGKRLEIWFWGFEAFGLTLNTVGAVLTMIAFQASSSSMQILTEPYPIVDINPNHRGKIVYLCANGRAIIRSTTDSVALGTSMSCSEKQGANAVSVVTSDFPILAFWGVLITVAGFMVQALTCIAALFKILKSA